MTNHHTAPYLSKQDIAFVKIEGERMRQNNRWGYEHDRAHSDTDWLMILSRKIGNLSEAIQEGGNVEREAVQCAAVLVAWLEVRE